MPVDFKMIWIQEYQFTAGAEKIYPTPVKRSDGKKTNCRKIKKGRKYPPLLFNPQKIS